MLRYIARRLIQAVPTLLAVSVLLFGLLHLAPGGPMGVYGAGAYVDQEELRRIEERLGLHEPIPIQYVKWLRGLVTGDWGVSFKYSRPVAEVVGARILPSLQLIGASLLLAAIVSIPFGILSAVSPRRSVQYGSSILSMLGISIPTFWLGMMILLFFSVKIQIFPTGGMSTVGEPFSVLDRIHHLIAPAIVLATLEIAAWSRYVRSSVLEVVGEDYVRTAISKGLGYWTVLLRHVMRNALLPLITLVGLQGGRLLGGALITEVVFAWPGMGRLLTESLAARDYPVLMAVFMLMSILVIVGNLAADVGYAIVDPRIRLE